MRDPHVVSLRYRIVTDKTISFENPPPVEWKTNAFHLWLVDGIATVQMIEHYSSERRAREQVEQRRMPEEWTLSFMGGL